MSTNSVSATARNGKTVSRLHVRPHVFRPPHSTGLSSFQRAILKIVFEFHKLRITLPKHHAQQAQMEKLGNAIAILSREDLDQ